LEGEELVYLWEKPIFDNSHKMINEYANSWTIDPEYIKANYPKDFYKENQDGSIEIEMVLYFQSQSYFYIGLIISGLIFIGGIGYLVWDCKRKRYGESLK
jgi:Ca2+-dependent lipid-binding protein